MVCFQFIIIAIISLLQCRVACFSTIALNRGYLSIQAQPLSREKKTNNRLYVTDKPFLEIHHPETNATVVLVGCLHGSSSSAKDVEQVLNAEPTDVVVLELCPTRFKDLMKYMAKKNLKEENSEEQSMIGEDYLRMVSKTIEAKGISTGVAAAVLGGASGLSSALSGFETGLEFITAIDYVERCRVENNDDFNGQNNVRNCDIILGDRLVDETLKRVGSLPTVSLEMWKNFLEQGWNWDIAYEKDASVLSNAVTGDRHLKTKGLQIDMGNFLFRNKEVLIDLLRLTLPTMAMIQMVVILFNYEEILVALPTTASLTEINWYSIAIDLVMETLTSALIILAGYVSLLLPSVRVILSERDCQLTEAINAACQIAVEKKHDQPRVVAVLGLLHVNGVAKRLLV